MLGADQSWWVVDRITLCPIVRGFTVVARISRRKGEGQPITVLSEAVVVPPDVVRLMELQEKGWSYVRP
jgi:intracellular sulfur oxidation DsrE/DsrF family protein